MDFKFTEKDKKYKKSLIKKMINNFKAEAKGKDKKDIHIFFDMDNCIALFSPFGDPKALKEMFKKGYFEKLEPLDNGIQTIEFLKNMGFTVHILSAVIPRNGDGGKEVMEEKRKWLQFHLPFLEEENIHFLLSGDSKAEKVMEFANIYQSILVDDYGLNLIDFIHAGGFAIKKTSGINKKRKERNIPTIHNCFEILAVLIKLEIIQ